MALSARLASAELRLLPRRLRSLLPPHCIRCGIGRVGLCIDCAPAVSERACLPCLLAGQSPDDGFPVESLGEYVDGLRMAILAFKTGRRDIGDALVDLLITRSRGGRLIRSLLLEQPRELLCVPIPTTPKRRRDRGFDGGCFLAEYFACAYAWQYAPLLRLIAADSQRGRTRHERLQARGRFCVRDRDRWSGAKAVLLDDVTTTGATLADAAVALREAGVFVVGAYTLARTTAPSQKRRIEEYGSNGTRSSLSSSGLRAGGPRYWERIS